MSMPLAILTLAMAPLAMVPPLLFLQADGGNPLAGRWDLTLKSPTDTYPSWMELTDANGTPQVRIVGRVSSVHPATNVKRTGPQISFETTEWFGKRTKVQWMLNATAGKLTGKQQREDGLSANITGVKSPALQRTVAEWAPAEPLFNGKDLQGWAPLITEPGKDTKNNWQAIGGELVNTAPGANIQTTRTFQDFKMHVEFNCPQDGNSGLYLRGRYEMQIEYEPAGTDDNLHGMGSIYGFLAPSIDLPKTPGKWESADITFVGRTVTLVRNGKTIINQKEVPGITGGALDSAEGQPGPIYIQGDHTGGMKYRNITISQPRH